MELSKILDGPLFHVLLYFYDQIVWTLPPLPQGPLSASMAYKVTARKLKLKLLEQKKIV